MPMIDLQEAFNLIRQAKISASVHQVALSDALNLVLAVDVYADRDYPPFNRSAMDGFAVNTQWFNAIDQKRMPNQGTLLAGKTWSKAVDKTKGLRIMTGAPVPDGLDAVIRVEDTYADCDMLTFDLKNELKNGSNIAKKGEDLKQGELLMAKGTLLRPQNLQALATIGVERVEVYQPFKIALITTGDEVKQLGLPISEAEIRNSNYWSISSVLKDLGIDLSYYLHVQDSELAISSAIEKALKQCDILLLTGGVSMGEADFVPKCLLQNQIERVFHKIAIKPGKPLWFGKGKNQLVFGLPGNPLSTYLDLVLFVCPMLHQQESANKFRFSVLNNSQKMATIDRFVPFYFKNGKVATKEFNGSGDITALTTTDGFLYLPKNIDFKTDDLVKILTF
jgi:molybdopterin molybdotransferase